MAAKTKPCPCCGNALALPKQYLNAVGKMAENVGDFIPVIEEDLKIRLRKELGELPPECVELVPASFWDLLA